MKAILLLSALLTLQKLTIAQANLSLQQIQIGPPTRYQQRQFEAERNIYYQQKLTEQATQNLAIAQQEQAAQQQRMSACAEQVRAIWKQSQRPSTIADGIYKIHLVVEGANCEIMSVRVQNNRVVPAYALKEGDAISPITAGRGIVMIGNGAGQPSTQVEMYFIY